MKNFMLSTSILLTASLLCSCVGTQNTTIDMSPAPTVAPTAIPTPVPTATATVAPTMKSTETPTSEPTIEPTSAPTIESITETKTISDSNYSNLDKTAVGWGFKKIKGQEPSIYLQTQELLKKYNAYYLDTTKPKAMYLTFDEGYENGYTGAILDTLKKCNVPAAFFVTGPYLKKEKELVERMVEEGHIVGNHTVNHPNLAKLGDARKIAEELNALNKQGEELYGIQMNYMRPPEGEYSEKVLAVADDLGYKTVLWSFAYRDWDPNKQQGADYAYEQVTPYFHDGAILLLHAVSKDNAEALERIINAAKAQGYEFRSLDELQ